MNQQSILPTNWEIPEIFRRRVGVKVGRQRAMYEQGHLLVITHLPPKVGEKNRSGRFFWRDDSGNWVSNDLGKGAITISRHLDEYERALDLLEKEEEQASSSGDYFRVISQLSPLLRSARNLYAALQQARELFGPDKELINFRDRAYELERKAELLYAEGNNELNFLIAMQSENQTNNSYRMSVSAHRLNVLAAFFFPMVTLATIFGTNLNHGFENFEAPVPFLIMLAIGLVLGLMLNLYINFPITNISKKRTDFEVRPPRDLSR